MIGLHCFPQTRDSKMTPPRLFTSGPYSNGRLALGLGLQSSYIDELGRWLVWRSLSRLVYRRTLSLAGANHGLVLAPGITVRHS